MKHVTHKELEKGSWIPQAERDIGSTDENINTVNRNTNFNALFVIMVALCVAFHVAILFFKNLWENNQQQIVEIKQQI